MINFAASPVRALTLPLFVATGMMSPLAAQTPPSATPTPTPRLIPGLENFSLPAGPGTTVTRPVAPPPVARTVPEPAATPITRAAPARQAAAPAPRRVPAARAIPVPRPVPIPTPTPSPAPTASPTPIAAPSPEPVASQVPAAIAAPAGSAVPPIPSSGPVKPGAPGLGGVPWPMVGGSIALLLLIGAGGFWFWRRPAEEADEAGEGGAHATFNLISDMPPPPPTGPAPAAAAEAPPPPVKAAPPPKRGPHAIFDLGAVPDEDPAPAPAPVPAPAPPPPAGPVPDAAGLSPPGRVAAAPQRATLEVALRPKRAGTNLLSAAVEYELVIHNAGGAAAEDVRVDVRLLSAGAEQDQWLGQLFASPIERPITPPFTLPPEGAVELSGMAMMPKEALSVMNVQGRALFVPVVAINLLYRWAGGAGQTATSHVVGIDRGDGAKMAPFRVDGAPRMHGDVGQLPYIVSVRI